jgi:excisionase family DNA binding protein
VTGRLLTARTVADLLGVSTETILRWTRRGTLPAIRLPGGAIRFREDELEAWLNTRATPARGALTTTSDAARDGRYSALESVGLTTTPRAAAATDDEEH